MRGQHSAYLGPLGKIGTQLRKQAEPRKKRPHSSHGKRIKNLRCERRPRSFFCKRSKFCRERAPLRRESLWFAVFCPGTGDADVDEDAFDPEAPVGNIQPVTVGSGQIPVIPLPAPPPPCDIAA